MSARASERGYAAVDLGAGSGRVVYGRFGRERLELDVVHRFQNGARPSAGHERWPVAELQAGVEAGLARLAGARLASVGVDGFGVDYALLDARGELVEEPISYRDARTEGAMEAVFARVPRAEIFAATGIQFLPINTLYQLFAHVQGGGWPTQARRLLLLADWFAYRLSGEVVGERTLATTSQLVGIDDGEWHAPLFEKLGLPLALMPPLVPAGTRLGELRASFGLGRVRVVAPAAHDTASAVLGTPLEAGDAYISSGTWSLVGIETRAPALGPDALAENLTNEGGAYGTIRLLANVMGLWILERCALAWGERTGLQPEPASAPPFAAFLAPDDRRFLAPPDMPAAIAGFLAETGQPAVRAPATLARVVLESTALRYADRLRALERVSGQPIRAVRIVGGGSRNDFLNQATANATGLPVLAGPVEATALGNLLVQAIADGRFADTAEARAYLRAHVAVRRFLPRDVALWREAAERFARLDSSHGTPGRSRPGGLG